MSTPSRPTHSISPRVAIVVGAGSKGEGIGNGRAAAILLAEAGARVACVDISQIDADRTVQMIRHDKGSGEAFSVVADVSKEEQCKHIVDETISKYGRIDILVNNVGIIGARGSATVVDMSDWDVGMGINVNSMVMMAKYAIPHMAKNEGNQYRGSIVNLSSIAGMRGGSPDLMYATSKGAIINMTRAMAEQHAVQGIRVNCVCPGMVYTPIVYAAGGMSDSMRESRKNQSLLKTEGYGWDIGAAVRFLSSDEARWITGVILPVDAGVTCAISVAVPDKV
ncbi:NAD(P)-binding protein [Pyrenochaeta sp. DS3sAY3a]|nr:NAD(P)-binding protein [Pyrenochaeta sp. DS3sAY3a]